MTQLVSKPNMLETLGTFWADICEEIDTRSPVTDTPGTIHSLSGEGWAEQGSTTGKNLVDEQAFLQGGIAGDTGNRTTSTTRITSADIPVSLSTQYVLTFASNFKAEIYEYDANRTYLAKGIAWRNSGYVITTKANTAFVRVLCAYQNDAEITPSAAVTTHLQLEAGSTATPYEPYSGGKPSPSPDYPQEIKVARGRNLFESTYSNLACDSSGNIVSASNVVSLLAKVEKGKPHTVSRSGGNRFAISCIASGSPASGMSGTSVFVGNASNSVYTFTPTTDYVFVTLDNNGSGINWAQLQLGSVPTPYVPYGHVGLEVQGRNLFDKDTALSSKYIDENGDVASGSNAFVASGFMPVTGGETYTLSGAGSAGTAPRGAFYDESGAFISAFASGPITVEAPSNAAYARVSVRTTWLDTAQFERGTATDYEPYHHTTTPIPLPSKGWAGGLPDGTADALALDSAGHVEWALGVSYTDMAVTDGVSATVGTTAISSTGQLADGADVYYKTAPNTEDKGYIDLPSIPEDATVDIPELREIGASYFVEGAKEVLEACRQWYERGRYEADDIEDAIADLATRVAALENE